MPFNAGGSTTRTTKTSGGTTWASDAAASNPINAAEFDTEAQDIYTMLALCITSDGNQTVNADIPLNNHKITGLATPVSSTDAATKAYVDATAGSPINTQTGNYTTVLSDSNKTIYISANGSPTFTIAANASVAYPVGTYISFMADGNAGISIAINSDTLVLAGVGTTGTRSLALNGIATALKVATTRWYISGPGLT
jgi:hypothetical protein